MIILLSRIGTFSIARIQLMMEVKPMIKKIEAEPRTVRFKAPRHCVTNIIVLF